MRKIAVFTLLCILLTLLLSGCSDTAQPTAAPQDAGNFLPDATAFPAATAAPEAAQTPEPTLPPVMDEPLDAPLDATIAPNADMLAALSEGTEESIDAESAEEATEEPEPTQTPEPVVTPEPTAISPYSGYNYSMLNDTAFGFVLNHPTTWINLPGKYTVCFEEPVSDDDFAARVAVTSKKMPHKPDADALLEQFQAFAKEIYKNFDPSTFEFGELETDGTFMGKRAMEISYLAYSGDIEVQGYMCCCAIDYTIYVYHFCSSYNDYQDMLPVMTRIRDSVTLVQ